MPSGETDSGPRTLRSVRNGCGITKSVYNALSSFGRLTEYLVVPAGVCNGQEPARLTLDGRQTDQTFRRKSLFDKAGRMAGRTV